MNHQLKCLVKETPDELSYRKKYFPNCDSVKSQDLLCRICDDTLTKNSFKIHPILGILLCKQCYEENKSADKQKCMVCNEDGKLIECKSKKCSYLTCEKCMTRLNSGAKSFYKQGKWNCFACHTKPLYKLRGISAVMASNSEDQSNKRIINKAQKTNGQLLSRSDSTSSSGTEFTKTKILDTNLSSSRSKHHNLSEISDNESHEDDTLTNRQLLDFKHNVKKLFDGLKDMGNKLLEEVDKAQQNFHSSKRKLKSSDVVNMISECKNIIQHVQDSTNKQEKKLIERHKTWCRKSKIKNTLFQNDIKSKKQDNKNYSSDEGQNKITSTPIKNTERMVKKTNSKLNVSDCDEQVFSGDENNRNINNDTDMDENPLDQSKDLFSDDGLNDTLASPKSSKKSSEESDTENNKRKKRFLKVKSKNTVNSDDESDSSEKVKPKRRLSKTKLDKIRERSKTKLLDKDKNKSSDSDFTEDPTPTKGSKQSDDSCNNNNNNNNNKTDVNISNKNPGDVSSDLDSNTKEKTNNISESEHENNDKEEQAKNDLLKSSSESDNEDKNSILNSSDSEHLNNDDLLKSSSDNEDDKNKNKNKVDKDKNSILNSSDSEHHNDDKAKEDLLKSSSDSDNDKKKKKDEEAKNDLLKSSSDSDNEDKNKKVDEDKNSILNSSDSEHHNDDKAKEDLLKSSSDSDNEDDKNKKKKKDEEAKNDLLKSSDSENEDDKNKKKMDEEVKNSILNSSSDSEKLNDDKAKEDLLKSSSDSDNEDKNKKKIDEPKKDLLNSSSESDKEKNLFKKKANNNKNNSSSDNETTSSKSKKRKLKIKKFNSSDDKKLKLKCIVELNRLSKKTLSQHSKALRLSAEYLENKKVSSLLSLDGLDKKKKKKKHRSDSSTDESSNSRSRKKTKLVDETLLDHLKKVETGNGNNDSNNSASEDEDSGKKIVEENEPSLDQQADKIAKSAILASSESSDNEETPVEETLNDSPSSKNSKDGKKKNKKNDTEDQDKEDDKEKKSKGNDSWKRSKLLTSKILDSDSDVENLKAQEKLSQRSKNDESDSNKEADDSFKVKKKTTRTRRRRLDSDSDVKISDDSGSDSDDDNKKNKGSDGDKKEGKKSKRKKRSDSSDSSLSMVSKKNKTKRRRIRAVADSDDSSDDDLNSSQGGANKSGRKNIRKVLKDKHVDNSTLQAAKQEEERIKRMAERQKLYNEMYEARLASEAKVDKLVLDFDAETKQVLLEVDENLVKRLKPHQAKGIKFMWDACFESLERIKESEGSGGILAHCMGLGKSFQVVTLSHTLLTHSEKTGINTILIVVPLSTVLNWMNEFKIWLSEVENGADIELYEMTKAKTNLERRCQLENWQRTGGVLIIGYEMFRNLCAIKGKVRKSVQEAILKTILDPGPDLIVCDEGHLLKNEDSAISKAIRRVKTLRRIVLTGTPLQNNLIEYHCMVQFVKPNLLGTKKEFSNRFVNPIQNGQFDDSTEYDVKLMKKRAHVLHKMLEGSVQRFDYSVLTPFLPPKQEYVISIRLTPVQVKLYQYYIDNFARKHKGVGGSLFADFQALSRLWTHPFVVKLHTENSERIQQKKREAETDSEGSLKDFIDDGSESESSSVSSNSSNSSNESDVITLDDEDGKNSKKNKPPPPKRGTRANPVAEPEIPEPEEAPAENKEWWTEFVKEEDFDDMRLSAKLMILFDIIKEAEAIGDKVLVFSQSLYSLTLIEKFLGMIDDETQNGKELDSLDKHTGCWAIGQDYFRFDGQTSAENRSHWVKSFNKPSNTRARLFLISTRAGGLGINLTAANRVVIFDASWNPSHDVQSIFRIYRFGQKKPCYVYRLLAAGTMEEKIYNRQVTKLSLSCRVVDELQIERHYSNNDLAELYKFDPPSETTPDLALPKDRLLAEIFLRHKNLVETFHEHDSLLENIAEEELDAEERKQAWQEYEDEKAGKRMIPPQMMINYSNVNQNLIPNHQHMLMMQQYGSQMMNSLNQLNNPNKQVELSQLMSMFQQDYPQLNEQQHRAMALKALSNMYNYVENQMVGRGSYNTGSVMPNPVNSINNPTATLANALAQQEYTRLHSGSGYNQQNLTQQQRQMMYSQSFGNNSFGKTQQKTPANPPTTTTASKQFVSNDDSDDIIEIPSSSSSRVNQASNAPKRQEE
ncbi:transcriptional regulator ATRX homolog isoform X1 [Cotesia glomerata]|uniref:transcriptional regulator ATRX homolog isoform X1 n=1 Tax=Cotesia glomerata TaxID=32391 RepID=UPI001D00B22B|nr:transcriptional regulator ATRX homolog isoform X1 [Cotesia glomerata]